MTARRGRDSLIALLALLFLAAAFDAAAAGTVWTDYDGDGLPDCGPANAFDASVGTVVGVDVWVDSQSSTWTGFMLFVAWDSAYLTFSDATYYDFGDGTNAPVFEFIGLGASFSGNGYSNAGVDRIARLELSVDNSGNCCVWPNVDYNSLLKYWSYLTNDFLLFEQSAGTCFEAQITAPDRWGRIGGLYR